MGGSVSRQALSSHKKLLARLTGPTSIDYSDTFWQRLGEFPLQLSSVDPREVEKVLAPYCQQLVVNSRTTQNFQKLILRVIGNVKSSAEDPDQLLLAANCICFLRFLIKHILGELAGPEFTAFVDGQDLSLTNAGPPLPEKDGLLHRLVIALLDVIVASSISGTAYLVQLEAVRLLSIGCSTQLYTALASAPLGTHPVLDILMTNSQLSGSVLQTLLVWFVQRPGPPSGVGVFQRAPEEQASMLRYVKSAAATVFWLPVAAYQYLVGSESSLYSPLADSAQLLLLILVNHAPQPPITSNPFKNALKNLQDVAYLGGVESSGSINVMGSHPSVSFGALYDAISNTMVDERSILLLYILLQCCPPFREYVLVRTDLETLMLPVLKQAYSVSAMNQSQLYLLSIILLILSQDASFSQNIHKITISGPEWYKDRMLGKTTLGSLLITILLRTAHQNMAKLKDVYLHTNTIAALTNMTCSITSLSSYAAQRLLSLVDIVSRKYGKAMAIVEGDGLGGVASDSQFQLQYYSDFLRTLMEMINGIVTTNLGANPELVYALLHRQGVMDALERFPQFGDLLHNMKYVTEFFNARIEEAKSLQPGIDWSVEKVLEVVRTASRSWRTDRLRPFAELKFSYEEEQSPEQFFVPLVWTLFVSHSDVPYDMTAVALFQQHHAAPSIQESDDFSVDMSAFSTGQPYRSSSNGVQEIEAS